MLVVQGLGKSFRLPEGRPSRRGDPADPRERAGLFHALRPVTFEAAPGRILGVLGPNGAGKTTLLRLLSTAMRPSSGQARFDGIDLVGDPGSVRRRLGFLGGASGLYGRLTALEMVTYVAQLYGAAPAVARARSEAMLASLGLTDALHRRCDALSAGMRQKVSIARTLVHEPDLVVLDEPTTGLDVMAARTIVDGVARLREQGRTVIVCTHHMHEVDALCDDLLVLARGEVCFRGTPETLRRRTEERGLDRALIAILERTEVGHAA